MQFGQLIKHMTESKKLLRTLKKGGVAIFPTETVYGLGCDATHLQALAQVYEIKNRPPGKAFPILVKDIEMLKKYAELDEDQHDKIFSAKEPTTFVLKARNLPRLAMENGTAAFRIASHPLMQDVLSRLNKPVVATSANDSDRPVLSDPRKYEDMFGAKAKLIHTVIFDGVNRKTKGSRIVDLTSRPYKILRK